MKKYLLILVAFVMISCEGSDAYQGKWKAMDSSQAKVEIVFLPKSFSITDSIGKSKTYEYSQNSVEIKNATATYAISLDDGRGYKIYFPTSNKEVGLILDENGNQVFTISRNDYISYEDIYKL